LRGGKSSLLSAFGSGRFAHKLGHQLRAAAKPVSDVRLGETPPSQQSHKARALSRGGRLGLVLTR
jgi:hypothetical protein